MSTENHDKPKYPDWLVQGLGILLVVLVVAGTVAFLYWRLSSGDTCGEFEC